MNYTLQIDLVGSEKVEAILQKLSGLSGSLASGGSPLGNTSAASRDVSDIARSMAAGAKASAAMVKDLDKISSGGGNLGGLAKLPEALREKIFAQHPELRKEWESKTGAQQPSAASGIAGMFKGVRWTSKEMLGNPRLPDVEQYLPKVLNDIIYKGLKDVSGKDLAKIKALPDISDLTRGVTRGIRDVTGKDLAKVQALGDINDAAKKIEGKGLKDTAAFMKDMTFLMMPLMNPGSLWATLFSTRQTFSAMMTEKGQGMLGKFGLSGIGGAATGTAALVGGATAVGIALLTLKKTIEETIKAYEYARQLYSKALQSGMGLQWETKRSLVAQIIGVSEQDVFRFGAQLAYLNPKLEWASSILAKTATPLTQVSWEFMVLKADLSALFATIAKDAAPAIMDLIKGLEGVVKVAKLLYDVQKWMPGTLALRYVAWQQQMVWKGIGKVTGTGADTAMPSPQAWMKQLPASHWERMGLVIGGSTADYAKQTAKNTGSMAKDIKTIAKFVAGGGRFGGAGAGGDWNMSATTAQP